MSARLEYLKLKFSKLRCKFPCQLCPVASHSDISFRFLQNPFPVILIICNKIAISSNAINHITRLIKQVVHPYDIALIKPVQESVENVSPTNKLVPFEDLAHAFDSRLKAGPNIQKLINQFVSLQAIQFRHQTCKFFGRTMELISLGDKCPIKGVNVGFGLESHKLIVSVGVCFFDLAELHYGQICSAYRENSCDQCLKIINKFIPSGTLVPDKSWGQTKKNYYEYGQGGNFLDRHFSGLISIVQRLLLPFSILEFHPTAFYYESSTNPGRFT